jgi:hypothetical protein
MDAAKFAFALAVNRGCEPAQIEGAGTIWNVGSFDDAGELRALIQNLFPNVETPYRALESLMNAGFGLLSEEMTANPDLRVEDLLHQKLSEK